MIDDLLANKDVLAAMDIIHPAADHTEAMARVAWTVLTEPNDSVAGALIEARGAVEALSIALGQTPYPKTRTQVESIARWEQRTKLSEVEHAIRRAREVGAHLLIPGDAAWPTSVDELGAHSPIALWVRGDASLLTAEPRVAIVGTRSATSYGLQVTREFTSDLVRSGAVLLGGGAFGVEGESHRAALAAGGKTIAFIGNGVDRAYPAAHDNLLQRIAEHGALVSEVTMGASASKWRFTSRQRLIAAVSQAVIVVEAGYRSGTLVAAGNAVNLKRPLGAVPGPVTSPASSGCHALIRDQGAACVTSAADIKALLAAGRR